MAYTKYPHGYSMVLSLHMPPSLLIRAKVQLFLQQTNQEVLDTINVGRILSTNITKLKSPGISYDANNKG